MKNHASSIRRFLRWPQSFGMLLACGFFIQGLALNGDNTDSAENYRFDEEIGRWLYQHASTSENSGDWIFYFRHQPRRMNVLLITVDDMGYNTPASFGGHFGDVTPNIDRLASEGMRFLNAYVALSICAASRQSMMTGRYPHNGGFRWFEPVADNVPLLTEVLSRHGYLNACIGKANHLQPQARYRWEVHYDLLELKGGRDPATYYTLCRDFIEDAQRRDKPFFLMANTHDPHRPFHGDDDDLRERMENLGGIFAEPSKVWQESDLPEDPLVFLPPVPEVLKQTAQYLSSCRRADDAVGEILRALDDTGNRDNTVVILLSDNGMPFPFAKAQTYYNSLRTPFIVRWPGLISENTVDDVTILSTNDLMPTILEITGIEHPGPFDGRSIVRSFQGEVMTDKDAMVGVLYHSYPVAEGPRPDNTRQYQTRSHFHDGFMYIYNHWSDGVKMNVLKSIPAILNSMREHGFGERADFFRYRAKEELYDLRSDPNALHNLAYDPQFSEIMQDRRERLMQWMLNYNDIDLRDKFEKFLQDL